MRVQFGGSVDPKLSRDNQFGEGVGQGSILVEMQIHNSNKEMRLPVGRGVEGLFWWNCGSTTPKPR